MYKRSSFLMAILVLASQSSCRKAFDYVHNHPDVHDNTLCRVTKLTVGNFEIGITYNSKGDPLEMLVLNPYLPFTTTERHFRYDRYGRLTDYIVNFRGPDIGGIWRSAALTWHKYGYPRPDVISDTVIAYPYPAVYITDPAPIAPKPTIFGLYKFNAAGKMIAAATGSTDPTQPPPVYTDIAYDARGNRADLYTYPDLTYDSAINVYRTNKVWQLIFNDYSRNNPVFVTPNFPFQLPTPTNQYGLPTQLPYINKGNVSDFGIGASSYLGSYYNIEYACSVPGSYIK